MSLTLTLICLKLCTLCKLPRYVSKTTLIELVHISIFQFYPWVFLLKLADQTENYL